MKWLGLRSLYSGAIVKCQEDDENSTVLMLKTEDYADAVISWLNATQL